MRYYVYPHRTRKRGALVSSGGGAMYQNIDRQRPQAQPKFFIPALGGVYPALERLAWPLVRVATGLFFMPHGMQKLFGFWGGNIASTIEGFAKQGLEPAWLLAYYIGSLEF